MNTFGKCCNCNYRDMEIKEGHIIDFHNDYKPANYPPKKDGFYMTIRCGLGGIYYYIDGWKDERWQLGILDGSYVIAYSIKQIPKEVVNEWLRNKLKANGY